MSKTFSSPPLPKKRAGKKKEKAQFSSPQHPDSKHNTLFFGFQTTSYESFMAQVLLLAIN